jgi:hypothetical protein
VLFTDRLQKRITVQEKVKVRKKPRFEDVHMTKLMYHTAVFVDDFDIRIRTKQVNLGTDLSTLEDEIDSGKFCSVMS